MVASKCKNCGAKITDGAQFCPGCGATKEAGKPIQKPVQAKPVAPIMNMTKKGSSPLEGLFDMIFSKTVIILAVLLGILLAWIEVIVGTFSSSKTDSGTFLNATGFARMSIILIGAGIWNKKIAKIVRLGMLIIGGAAIIWVVNVSALQSVSLGSLFNQFVILPMI